MRRAKWRRRAVGRRAELLLLLEISRRVQACEELLVRIARRVGVGQPPARIPTSFFLTVDDPQPES